MSYDLKELFKGIDARPFTGERELTPTVVICKGEEFPNSWFSPSSILGATREEYYKNAKEWGLTPGKEYIATKVDGHGDVFDILIENTDLGEESWFMSLFFKLKDE